MTLRETSRPVQQNLQMLLFRKYYLHAVTTHTFSVTTMGFNGCIEIHFDVDTLGWQTMRFVKYSSAEMSQWQYNGYKQLNTHRSSQKQ